MTYKAMNSLCPHSAGVRYNVATVIGVRVLRLQINRYDCVSEGC